MNSSEALIVSVGRRTPSIEETIELARSAGYRIIGVVQQRSRPPDSRFYVGPGKLEELKKLLKGNGNVTLIVNGPIKPSQAYNLMKELKVRVIDRTQLILEIFAQHAGSKEAKLQIELAMLRHMLPFIREFINLSKRGELPGYLGGGGYKVDAYYKYVTRRIARIRRELEELRDRRRRLIENRRRWKLPHIAITGYTCAGKTSLFNALTKSCRAVDSTMFTTLTPKSSAIVYNGRKAIVTDTVGFIDDVPIEIIEAFYSTLAEIAESDLILLVVDASEEDREVVRKLNSSLRMLEEIGAQGRPLIVVANKCDLIGDHCELARKIRVIKRTVESRMTYVSGVAAVSAKTGENIDALIKKIFTVLYPRKVTLHFRIPRYAVTSVRTPLRLIEDLGDSMLCEVDVTLHNVTPVIREVVSAGGVLLGWSSPTGSILDK